MMFRYDTTVSLDIIIYTRPRKIFNILMAPSKPNMLFVLLFVFPVAAFFEFTSFMSLRFDQLYYNFALYVM